MKRCGQEFDTIDSLKEHEKSEQEDRELQSRSLMRTNICQILTPRVWRNVKFMRENAHFYLPTCGANAVLYGIVTRITVISASIILFLVKSDFNDAVCD